MNLSEANRTLWLWLHERGGYWTCEEIARRTGYASINIFRALHDMARRHLIEQVDPSPGERRKRYGVSGDCLVPLGIKVGEMEGNANGVRRAQSPAPGALHSHVIQPRSKGSSVAFSERPGREIPSVLRGSSREIESRNAAQS